MIYYGCSWAHGSVGERLVHTEEVSGSNPLAPTRQAQNWHRYPILSLFLCLPGRAPVRIGSIRRPAAPHPRGARSPALLLSKAPSGLPLPTRAMTGCPRVHPGPIGNRANTKGSPLPHIRPAIGLHAASRPALASRPRVNEPGTDRPGGPGAYARTNVRRAPAGCPAGINRRCRGREPLHPASSRCPPAFPFIRDHPQLRTRLGSAWGQDRLT